MCYHISQRQKNPQKISELFDAENVLNPEHVPVYYHLNGFSHANVMVMTQEEPDIIQLATWGIAPPHYKDSLETYWKKYTGGTLNTRDDKFFQNYFSWKDEALLKNKCLILIDGLYEPHKPSQGKNIPFFFERPNHEMFGLLGIYTHQGGILTCSVITTTADPLFEKIHNGAKRMPMCVAPEDKDYMILMNRQDSLKEEFKIFRSIELNAYPVSRDVINAHKQSDYPEIINRLEYAELS
ncbi:Putative SOS response-associated peptidase YedK [Zhouia amylolytica]|uniref:Abasic site processing protein n=1 Tax=Zhouia amylolytica TaxID=376730 RepID=A0A1I6TA26_9FLAO|nr:SOS response-associated peptidase family protein [Zhouia amylolytica]SFS85827.1 Putative SOS response-associated peptidase YedK [Zhouia amylolytica]